MPSPVPPSGRPTRREIALAVLGSVVRLLIGFWLIVFLLQLVPEEANAQVILPIGVAILAAVGYIFFFRRQLKVVYHAKFPTLRAAEALILVAAMFLAVFTMIYVTLSLLDASAFTEQLSPFNGYYFSLTVLATVGFGDITPVTTLARSVTMVQMALDLAFVAVAIRVIGGAARKALELRNAPPDLPETAEALEE